MRPRVIAALAITSVLAACVTQGGADWVQEVGDAEPEPGGRKTIPEGIAKPENSGAAPAGSRPPGAPIPGGDPEEGGERPVVIREHGRAPRAPANTAPANADSAPGAFRNTYYDFPSEGPGPRDATLFDATCAPLARVTRDFHDRVCVQGSGRIAAGATVSFARRDCACADVCPRTSQRICFERLDPAQFPHGRGAMGRPITPLRTVAVDSTVIPLGTSLYIPEFAGTPKPDGTPHDGCFVAEDRGIRVVGRHIDVFTGDPAVTARWNALVPSNRGVSVVLNDPRCGRAAPPPGGAARAAPGPPI
ncbi:MAG TPA: 3D domain-containing protein [Polyangiaceae bacterium]|nr:3D domain-containing protein [Polyangiaceae bacterium]